MAKKRPVLGDAVHAEAFQLFRLLGFDSLTAALGIEGEEEDEVQYMAGMSMGRALVRRGRVRAHGPDEAHGLDGLMASFGELYRRMGLGIIEYRTGEDGSLVVSVAECAGCHGAEFVDRPICFVEAGLLCGLLSEALGGEYTAREHKCIGGKGDEVCEFIITRVSA